MLRLVYYHVTIHIYIIMLYMWEGLGKMVPHIMSKKVGHKYFNENYDINYVNGR